MDKKLASRIAKLEKAVKFQAVRLTVVELNWRALVDQFALLALRAGIDPERFRKELQERRDEAIDAAYPDPPSPPSKTRKKPKQ